MVGGSQVTESLFSRLGGCSGSWSFAIRHVRRLIFNISNLLCPAAPQMGRFPAFRGFSSLPLQTEDGHPKLVKGSTHGSLCWGPGLGPAGGGGL